MTINQSGWRPEMHAAETTDAGFTTTGNRALMLEEPLIFEIGGSGTTGVDIAKSEASGDRLGSLARSAPIGLPGLSEPETVRHYTRLSRQNYAIDLGLFPLGSCTMKHNPRLNEKVARLPGFADLHPLAPIDTVQGALEVIHQLGHWLVALTGMHSVAMSPKAGAHGELCGILAIRAALEASGQGHRKTILVPESAHGTNPATAAFAGYAVEGIPATAEGRVDLAALTARLGPDVAGVMITNPNTCGLFERDMKADLRRGPCRGRFRLLRRRQLQRHRRPGAAGRPRHRRDAHQPAQDLLHPARRRQARCRAGGVLRSAVALRPAPVRREDRRRHVPAGRGGDGRPRPQPELRPDDRVPRPDGHVHPRARLYPQPRRRRRCGRFRAMRVLNANYLLRSLEDVLDAPFARVGPVHARGTVQRSRASPRASRRSTSAKALIDEGFHPMTMCFPLVVHGAMLVEPTETESKASLDQFIGGAAAHRRARPRRRSGRSAQPALRPAPPARRDPGGAQPAARLARAGYLNSRGAKSAR